MKNVIVATLMLIATASVARAADYGLDEFVGTWRSTQLKNGGVTRLNIERTASDKVNVQAVGRCGSRECELGQATGVLFTNTGSASDADFGAILVQFNRNNVRGHVLLRLNRVGNIVSHSLLTFKNEGDNIYRFEQFEREGDRLSSRYPSRSYGYRDEGRYDRYRRYD